MEVWIKYKKARQRRRIPETDNKAAKTQESKPAKQVLRARTTAESRNIPLS